MRAAIAWAGIPGITFQLVLLIAVLLGPVPMPPGAISQIDPAFYKVGVVEFVLGIWGFFVELKCLSPRCIDSQHGAHFLRADTGDYCIRLDWRTVGLIWSILGNH